MELLAPAGDLNILKSAFAAGADAVYFGGDAFGARVNAGFSLQDGLSAIEYAHSRGKSVYLTVNTLLKNVEMERRLYDFLLPYDKAFVDGIIVQDFGIFSFCRKHFPNLPLHASTQMNIASREGAAFMMDHGACRIVPARELSISEIAAIHEALPDLEIEAFLHGALCVCYSGQCLMSSFIGGRSGNRGACAQPCRKKYVCLDDTGKVLGDFGYYLSPKDLCGLYALPRLFEAGVTSYKIEGRLKNEAYVAGVVSVYRKYFDRIIDDGTAGYTVDEADYKRLLSYGNRGGSTDKYFDMRNDLSMIDPAVGAFRQDCAEVSFDEKKRRVDVTLLVNPGEPLSLNVTFGTKTVSVEGEMVAPAQKRATTAEEIEEKLKKTGEEAFDINELRIELFGEPFVPMKHIKDIRRRAFDTMTGLLGKDYFTRVQKPYAPIESLHYDVSDEKRLYVSVETKEQLFTVSKLDYVYGIFLPEHLLSKEAFCGENEYYFKLPTVIRRDDIKRIRALIKEYDGDLSGVVANSYDALGLLESMSYPKERIIFGERLYAYSDRTVEAFMSDGYERLFVPQELNEKELSHRYNGSGIMEIYSQTAVMVMANCPAKRFYGCKKRPYTKIDLIDERGAVFPVVNHCDSCTNYVYNSLPMSLLEDSKKVKALKAGAYLMSFVFEEAKEVEELLSLYKKNFLEGLDESIQKPVTRGHFKRGVQ